MGASAAAHGSALLALGYSVDQVVHDYGDLCQAVAELAIETKAPFTTDEFRTLNRCLDNAIADAVTEYSRGREQRLSDENKQASNERLGEFAHELRNALNTATLAIGAIRTGKVAFGGSTGAVFDRSMIALRDLIDRSLADVRLAVGIPVPRDRIPLAEFIEEVQVAAAMEASVRGLDFTVAPVDRDLVITTDRQILAAAVSNLLSNAFKFSRAQGHVSLSAQALGDRILIEIEDECGGLSTEKIEHLFRPFDQQDADRSGVGLGLVISRRGVEAIGGTLSARSVGTGCVFTIDLAKQADAP
jgi:signal transduction histidine kinase